MRRLRLRLLLLRCHTRRLRYRCLLRCHMRRLRLRLLLLRSHTCRLRLRCLLLRSHTRRLRLCLLLRCNPCCLLLLLLHCHHLHHLRHCHLLTCLLIYRLLHLSHSGRRRLHSRPLRDSHRQSLKQGQLEAPGLVRITARALPLLGLDVATKPSQILLYLLLRLH